jgi:hypothetical protein
MLMLSNMAVTIWYEPSSFRLMLEPHAVVHPQPVTTGKHTEAPSSEAALGAVASNGPLVGGAGKIAVVVWASCSGAFPAVHATSDMAIIGPTRPSITE